MNLEVRDPVLAAVARQVAVAAPGVARLHDLPWPTGVRTPARGRGVEVGRRGSGAMVTLRLVVRRGSPVIDVVHTVQRSVRDEVLRLTGRTAEVVVVVVDLDWSPGRS